MTGPGSCCPWSWHPGWSSGVWCLVAVSSWWDTVYARYSMTDFAKYSNTNNKVRWHLKKKMSKIIFGIFSDTSRIKLPRAVETGQLVHGSVSCLLGALFFSTNSLDKPRSLAWLVLVTKGTDHWLTSIDSDKGIDGSARKPALVQDTGYMVEKTYHIATYLGAFGPI